MCRGYRRNVGASCEARKIERRGRFHSTYMSEGKKKVRNSRKERTKQTMFRGHPGKGRGGLHEIWVYVHRQETPRKRGAVGVESSNRKKKLKKSPQGK